MNNKADNKKAIMLALVATFFWSTVASAFEIGLRYLSPIQFLGWVILFAWIALTIIGTIKGIWKLKYDRKTILLGFIGGILNPFAYYLVLFNAYDQLPAQIAQSLNYTWPIVLVIFSALFLKQPFRALVFVGMLVSLSGVVVISFGSIESELPVTILGIILATGSSLIWASYWIINKLRDTNPIQQIWLNFTFALLLITPLIMLTGGVETPEPKGWLAISYSALFEMALTFVIWLTAMKLASSTDKISHYIYISPFLSLIFINLILDEPILETTIFGLGLIVAGILWTEYINKPKKAKS
jgi:drug/metabolite transporter (DMT)-like permease